MYSSPEVKSVIEKVNLEFLCAQFKLQRGTDCNAFSFDHAHPDLLNKPSDGEAPKYIFELKSRTFPQQQEGRRRRPISDFGWWGLCPIQIERYEKISSANNLELFWILLLAQTEKLPTGFEKISEKSICTREIYVAPWAAYNLVELSPRMNRHLGLARLKKAYDFKAHAITKGTLYIAESAENMVGKYF